MKKILTTLSILVSLSATAQTTKQVYYLSTLPTYDENGNVYQISQQYDHVPTSDDSSYFKKVSRIQMVRLIDSVRILTNPQPHKIKNSKQNKNK